MHKSGPYGAADVSDAAGKCLLQGGEFRRIVLRSPAGRTAGAEDTTNMADMINGKLQLPSVTLAAVSSVKIYETIKAMEYSMRGIDFGDAVLITHKKPRGLPKTIRYAHCEKIDNIDKFNHLMVYDLSPYIHTDFILLVHYDGFVIHPENWDDDFLSYDYIGSPWPLPKNDYAYRDGAGRICRVGNSVSIRSKRLLEFPSQHHLEWVPVDDGFYNEDIFLCCHSRLAMEEEGLAFAPFELAVRFGREHPLPENAGVEPFVFHKWRGENADYPRFTAPKDRVKNTIRPLLFWRRTRGWKDRHGVAP